MVKRKRKLVVWSSVGFGVLIWVAVVLFWWSSRDQGRLPSGNVELWDPMSHYSTKELNEVWALNRDLQGVPLELVEFDRVPFEDALREWKRLFSALIFEDRLSFTIDPEVSLDKSVKLRLENVPAGEALRYIAALNDGQFEVLPDQTIHISHIDSGKKRDEGWFLVYRGALGLEGEGPIDVLSTFQSAGVQFGEGDVAEYYPDEELLWVEGTTDQLELVQVYIDSFLYHPQPTWRDVVANWWWEVKEFFNPSPPTPFATPMVPSGAAHDPFADPFGGGGKAPDPFGGSGKN